MNNATTDTPNKLVAPERKLPEVGTPIGIEWECPEWCTVDHDADNYLHHGHVVHRANIAMPHGLDAELRFSPIATWREEPDHVVEVYLPRPSVEFTNGADLREYAAALATLADRLDDLNGAEVEVSMDDRHEWSPPAGSEAARFAQLISDRLKSVLDARGKTVEELAMAIGASPDELDRDLSSPSGMFLGDFWRATTWLEIDPLPLLKSEDAS